MSNGLENMIAKTRMMAGLAKTRDLNDRQLLEEFADGDETAFTALVDRYGGLVMSVCQRILQHRQDAEDAFQATFMVLARKAGNVSWEESVANWLHGVACRIAFQVRRENMRRRAEVRKSPVEPGMAAPDPSWSELKPVLDEELERLPAKYRMPLILCCLEGKSRDEAAAQLGWSPGSVKGRLERGRELLRSRLARRGLTLSAALAATLISTAGAKAVVPLSLGFETVRAGMAMQAGQTAGVVSIQVITLTQGALHAMFMTKIKFAAAVALAIITLGLGTGYGTHLALAGQDRSSDSNTQERQGGASDGSRDSAQRGERKAAPTVNGVVQTVDATKNTINILVARNEPDGTTLELAKDVKVITREGREVKDLKLADVKEKARVTLTLNSDKKLVQTIEIVGERNAGGSDRGGRGDDRIFRGLVSEIDAAKKTIGFQSGGRGEPPTTKTFDLAKDVKVTLRTGRLIKAGKLEDVHANTWIQAKLDEAKKIVEAIEISIPTTAYGAVSEVDAAKNTITVESGRGRGGNDGTSTTYALAKDIKVFYHLPAATRERGREGEIRSLKLSDLPAKANVSLQLDDELKVVQSIDVQLPHAAGSLHDIDAKKRTLVLKGARGGEMNLTIDKDAKIVVNGNDGKLDAVNAGVDAQVILTPDRMRVLYLRTPPAEGRE